MDVGKSFTFMFEDQDWIAKVAIGVGIFLAGLLLFWVALIPLLAAYALLLGYLLTVTKNVYDGSPTPLPDWSNLGALFVKGLYGMVGYLIWMLPVLILLCCIGLAFGVQTLADPQNAEQGGLIPLAAICVLCVVLPLALLLNFAVYAPMTRYAVSGELKSFWDFSGNLRFIQANLGNFSIAAFTPLVLNVLLGKLLFICCVGVLLQFPLDLVGAHLFGQVARLDASMANPPVEPATPM